MILFIRVIPFTSLAHNKEQTTSLTGSATWSPEAAARSLPLPCSPLEKYLIRLAALHGFAIAERAIRADNKY
jgi:hypothetical protein